MRVSNVKWTAHGTNALIICASTHWEALYGMWSAGISTCFVDLVESFRTNCWLRWLTTGYHNRSPSFFRSWIHPWIDVHARNELDKSPSEVPLDKQLCWSSKALHCKVPARGNTAMPERFEQASDQLLTPTKLLGRVPVLVGEWSRPWSDSLAIKNYPNNFTTLGQTTKSKDRI